MAALADEFQNGTSQKLPAAEDQKHAAVEKLPVLTAVDQIRPLKRDRAAVGYPVRLRGVVTCVVEYQNGFVIQDSTHGIYVNISGQTNDLPHAGDLLTVEGKTASGSFAPVVLARHFDRLGQGTYPEPVHLSWDQLLTGSLDDQWVELKGVVERAANHPAGYTNGWSRMMLRTQGGTIWVDVQAAGMKVRNLEGFENALVRLRGCLFAVLNTATRQVEAEHVRIYASEIIVDEAAPADLFSVPQKNAGDLKLFDPQASAFRRVKVSGQIIFIRGANHFMMDGTNGVRFALKYSQPLRVGDLVDVAGFPELSGVAPLLSEAVVRVRGEAPLPGPKKISPEDLPAGVYDSTWVEIEGQLTSARQTPTNQVLEIQSGAWRFLARVEDKNQLSRSLRIGSRLSLKGVYSAQSSGVFFGDDVAPFDLLMQSPSEIKVLSEPPWWTLQKLVAIVAMLACLLAVTGLWITQLHRQVEKRTRELAGQIQAREHVEHQRAMEQERARIARDLHDELGSAITEINMLVTVAGPVLVAGGDSGGQLKEIGDRSRQLVTTLDEIVWAMNPKHDSLKSLVSYSCLYADRFLKLANIGCRLKDGMALPDRTVFSFQRHEFFLAFKEALTNVVRHSGATEVRLGVRLIGNRLRFSISDNGCGLTSGANGRSGDGLINMRSRLEKLGGRFAVNSQPERGTTVRFYLPLS